MLFIAILYAKQLLLDTTDHIGQSNQNLPFGQTHVTMQFNDFCANKYYMDRNNIC